MYKTEKKKNVEIKPNCDYYLANSLKHQRIEQWIYSRMHYLRKHPKSFLICHMIPHPPKPAGISSGDLKTTHITLPVSGENSILPPVHCQLFGRVEHQSREAAEVTNTKEVGWESLISRQLKRYKAGINNRKTELQGKVKSQSRQESDDLWRTKMAGREKKEIVILQMQCVKPCMFGLGSYL